MKKLLYFHGFGSSGQTESARTLRELLPEFLVLSLDIPVDPVEALPYLKRMCEQGEARYHCWYQHGRLVCPADARI